MPESGEKGVCRLSVVPVRLHPSDTSEMVTQLLFGDHYSIVDIAELAVYCLFQILSSLR